MSKVFVVVSHVEVEINNWSTEVIRAFNTIEQANGFANQLKKQAESNETIEIEELILE
jgi:hypothetical protein